MLTVLLVWSGEPLDSCPWYFTLYRDFGAEATEGRNSCIRVLQQPMNFSDAKHACASMVGHLVTIKANNPGVPGMGLAQLVAKELRAAQGKVGVVWVCACM